METHKKYRPVSYGMSQKRSMPICFKPDELLIIEEYAKKMGMTNYSQAIEKLAFKSKS
ncbi:MAG: hypothetical protein WCB31_10615 [Nitrososphaeraceae archaeon]